MKIKLDREQFFAKISKVSKFVDDKPVLPALSNLKLSVANGLMEITGGDANMQCKMTCPVSKSEDFAICLPSKLLVATIGLFRENELTLTVKDKKVELVSGKGKGRSVYNITMDCFPAEYPQMLMEKVTSEITMQQFFLKSSFKSTRKFINEKATQNTALIGVHVANIGNKMVFTGVDDRVMCRCAVKPISINHWDSIVVPSDTANKLASLLDDKGEISIVHCGEKMRFFTNIESSDFFEVTGVTVGGKYPDSEKLFAAKPMDMYVLNTVELMDAMKRLMLYANDDDVPMVRFEVMGDSELQLVSSNVNFGRTGQEIITFSATASKPLTKTYNIENFIKILSIIESNEVRLFFEESPNRPSFVVPVVATEEEDIYSFLLTNILGA